MTIDLHESDPAFAGSRRPGEDVEELLAYCKEALGINRGQGWQLISSRMKLQKTFFEVEEVTPRGKRRLIGKVSSSEKSEGAYKALKQLWHAGMRPPWRHTVVEPVAYLPERRILLQEKAPGTQLLRMLQDGSATRKEAQDAARWLIRLQSLKIPVAPAKEPLWNFATCRTELPKALPDESVRLHALFSRIQSALSGPQDVVPSHGDFHPMNVYISPGRVSVIDLDTFAGREPMADVSYLLAQTAIMGYMTFGSFAATAEFRSCFLDAYSARNPQVVNTDRIAANMGFALLRSLHYDLCILKVDTRHLVQPFLAAAEECAINGNFYFAA